MQTEEIIHLALELGNAIAESEEAAELRAIQLKLADDPVAYELIVKYQDAREKLENKIEDGLSITKAEEDHLDILEQQLNANTMVLDLIQAQDKFNNLMQAIFFTINQSVSGGCASGCDSCDGMCS